MVVDDVLGRGKHIHAAAAAATTTATTATTITNVLGLSGFCLGQPR